MTPEDYTAVRVGMNVSKAIIEGTIDAGIGLENVQMVELAEWLASQGRPRDDVQMLRIDELAELGCCCFCTILYIGNEDFISKNPEKVKKFMAACKKATDFVIANPQQAFDEYLDIMPHLNNDVNKKIFERSFAYFSESLQNVDRDWAKVTKYGKRLGVLQSDFVPNYTNEFLTWDLTAEVEDPIKAQKLMAAHQIECSLKGGYRRLQLAN